MKEPRNLGTNQKRKQSEVAYTSKYDHSSDRQREVVNVRYNRMRDIVGALNIDIIKTSGVPKSTFYYRKKQEQEKENTMKLDSHRWMDHGETLEMAAKRFDKSEKTIRRWIKEGKVEKIEGVHVLKGSSDQTKKI
jgi:hypothetical protein